MESGSSLFWIQASLQSHPTSPIVHARLDSSLHPGAAVNLLQVGPISFKPAARLIPGSARSEKILGFASGQRVRWETLESIRVHLHFQPDCR
jgi:hypothetical protein